MKTELTALDHFAIAALPAIAHTATLMAIEAARNSIARPEMLDRDAWAREAFTIAEAMLAESEKRNRSI